jgi:hypothetical protein
MSNWQTECWNLSRSPASLALFSLISFRLVHLTTLSAVLHTDSIMQVKYIPAWFPGAGFKRKAEAWYKQSQAMLQVPFAMTKRKIVRL